MTPASAHALLGTRPGDGVEVIKSAYRRRCLETHPDRGGTADRFRLVTEAYEVIRSGEGDLPPSSEVIDLPSWVRGACESVLDKRNRAALNRIIGKDRATGLAAVAAALLGVPEVVRQVRKRKKKK